MIILKFIDDLLSSDSSSKKLLRTIQALTIMLLVGMAASLANWTATYSSWFDDALNSSVAKNLAFGHGYATSYLALKKFNFIITTGPVIILPAAAFIKILGNKYWVPHLAASLVNFSAFLFLLWVPSKLRIDSLRRWLFRLILVLLLVSLTIKLPYSCQWFGLWGEVAAGFLGAASILLMFYAEMKNNRRILFCSGILAGLAFLTKTLTLLNLSALVVFVLWRYMTEADKKHFIKSATLSLCLFMVGFMSAPASFEAYKMISMSRQEYSQLKIDEKRNFANTGSGFSQFKAAPSRLNYLASNLRSHIPVFDQYIGGPVPCAIFLLLLAFILATSYGKTAVHMAGYALFLSGSVHLGWWLFLSSYNWVRHFIIGFFLLLIGLSLLSVFIKRKYALLAGCLYAGFIIPKATNFKNLLPTDWTVSAKVQALLNTANFIEKNKDKYDFMQMDFLNDELEYILPGVCNFSNYMDKTNTGKEKILVRDMMVWHEQQLDIWATQYDKNILFGDWPYCISSIGIPDITAREVYPTGLTNSDWLNGVARSGDAAFFINTATSLNNYFTEGEKVLFADGTSRTIVKTKANGDTLVIFLDGPTLDGSKVGFPHKISVFYTSDNCTDKNWVNGVARNWTTAFFLKYSSAAETDFAVGKLVLLADGTMRTIQDVRRDNNNLIVLLDGAPLDGRKVGYPHYIRPIYAASDRTDANWLHGMSREGANAFVMKYSAGAELYFAPLKKVVFANGQWRNIVRTQRNTDSSLTVFFDGPAISGDAYGFPHPIAAY